MDPDLSNYPRSVTLSGLVLALTKETRWNRFFSDKRGERLLIFSRLEDGSAAMSLEEAQSAWAQWSDDQKRDFARAVEAGYFPERGEFMRFLFRNGDVSVQSMVAAVLTENLDPDEAFSLLRQACEAAPAGTKAMLFRAIAGTQAAGAAEFVRREHELLWRHPGINAVTNDGNDIAVDCISSLASLIELGLPRRDAEERMQFFREHPAPAVRKRATQGF